MRYLIYGAGAIGATIGGRLHMDGFEVALIGRGAHREALERDGLRLQTPDGEDLLPIPVAGSPCELSPRAEDVVVLAMKSQDTAVAVEELAAAADRNVAVVCAQNGVENERIVLRRFPRAYGMLVYLGAQHLEPGVVQAFSAPTFGVLDIGAVPAGADDRARGIAADLSRAGFASQATTEIMKFKYAKLLDNLGNAVDALLGPGAPPQELEELEERARGEALECYEAAGVKVASEQEMSDRARLLSPMRAVAGSEHRGSSSWQSLAREAGAIEVDYLNGEVVLLGRQHRLPTPVNEALQRLARAAARERRSPGSVSGEELEREIARVSGSPEGA